MPRSAKISQSYLMFWPTLSTPGSSSSGLIAASAASSGIWSGAELRIGREQVAAALGASVAMADRHVAGFVVADRQREAAEVRLHRIEAGGLGVDRDHADVSRARDPGVEPVERAHGLVFRAVDRLSRAASPRARLRGRWESRRPGLSSLCSLPRLRGRVGVGARTGRHLPPRLRPSGRGGRPPPQAGEVKPERAAEERGNRHLVRHQLRIRLDRAGIDAGLLDDAARQRGELHRLEEGDQVLVVRLVHREVRDRHVEVDMLVERDELLGQPRRLGVVDQRLPALLLLDLAGALQAAFRDRRIR